MPNKYPLQPQISDVNPYPASNFRILKNKEVFMTRMITLIFNIKIQGSISRKTSRLSGEERLISVEVWVRLSPEKNHWVCHTRTEKPFFKRVFDFSATPGILGGVSAPRTEAAGSFPRVHCIGS
ncbi:hypothetical protein EVAR_51304_1 [Eumeta japonica]|uniref:Uncharacterized protein n=1 Tax=Eumeta variegata TaxID=151549 RepID=A0A4C1XVF7_EUMVA|nr:hypothetical protein EVAR_51304_1 [Eumeta japonica]